VKSSKPWLYAAARSFDLAARIAFRRDARPMPREPRRILMSNIGHLGDALLSLGVPSGLRHVFPDAAIDVLVSSDGARLFEGHPGVSRILVHDALLLRRGVIAEAVAGAANGRGLVASLRDRSYDIAIELRSYVPNSIPLLARSGARFLCGFGSAGFSFLLDRVVPHIDGEHELHRFGRVIETLAGEATRLPVPELCHLSISANGNGANGRHAPYTVLHPGTRRRRKRWSREEWRRLAVSLTRSGRHVVITGAAEERRWIEATFEGVPVRIETGVLDIAVLAKLYGGASTFIGVDSFPAHLAAVAGAPRVIVVWHEYADPAEWAPLGRGHVSVLPGRSTHEAVLAAIEESA
jgi:ADP-heptose:LPS heptosyltransferase